jgi:serine/arginine repetitive matrix protein 2
MSILDAATNDLAQLINRLDLEATPGTPDMTPLRGSSLTSPHANGNTQATKDRFPESPVKGMLRESMASMNSLRPYRHAQSNPAAAAATSALDLIGQQIAPWPTLNSSISPVADTATKATKTTAARGDQTTPPGQVHKLRLTHKRTLTPAPAADPSPVFQPLCPARGKLVEGTARVASGSTSPTCALRRPVRAPSARTFGSRESYRGSPPPLPSPVFKKAEGQGHVRRRSSLVPTELTGGSGVGLPIPPEAKRVLGLGGTMGSVGMSVEDAEEDSDIPDELQVILAGRSDDEGRDGGEFGRESWSERGCPPAEPLPIPGLAVASSVTARPVFRARLNDDEQSCDIDEGGHSSEEEDTKKSFDFTGELKKLNESGGSDRRSFVEQLEMAFRTPAKIDLRYGFGMGFSNVEVPPMPKVSERVEDLGKGNGESLEEKSSESMELDAFSMSRIVDMKEPTLLLGSDSLGGGEEDFLLEQDSSPRLSKKSKSSMGSRPSDGQLNTEFKFGGRPQEGKQEKKKPLTLSDIIPPPSHSHSLSQSATEEDSAVLKSIFAKAVDIPAAAPRMRLDSDSSSKRQVRDNSWRTAATAHNRHSSEVSFAGFESFEEVRRGFEFANRQAYYPAANMSRRTQWRRESVFSIASVSSYGHIINPGVPDPFDYGVPMPVLRGRPLSMDETLNMSMTVDDTFSFIHRLPQRRRVDSEASSFYFRAPATSQVMHGRSGHRRHDSTMSITSQGPPISLYNRSFGHRKNDSSASVSSVAHSYAMYGANSGRAAWARHQKDAGSIDSSTSDFSAARLGRPGLGEKMFEKCEQSMPLTAISASPPESISGGRLGNRSSFDSILDNDRRSSTEDSLFDKTENRSSMSSDSVFGDDDPHSGHLNGHLLLPNQFRPLSMLSVNSAHSPMKEDDTMISVSLLHL